MSNHSLMIRDDGNMLQLGLSFTLAPTGLVINGSPTFDEWQYCGRVLRRIEGAVQFWIGDWINYGEKEYGDKYTAAIESTGRDYGTLRNYAYVAGRINLSFRNDKVDFPFFRDAVLIPDFEQVARAHQIPIRDRGVLLDANGAQINRQRKLF